MVVVVCGHCHAYSSPSSARSLGTASIVFSVIGLVIGVVLVIIVIVAAGGVVAFAADFGQRLERLQVIV